MKTLKCAVLILFIMSAAEMRAQESNGKKPPISRLNGKRPVKKATSEKMVLTPEDKTTPDKKTDSKGDAKTETKMKTTKKPIRKTVGGK